jgi:DNA-binding MarR family transcriptional regulator
MDRLQNNEVTGWLSPPLTATTLVPTDPHSAEKCEAVLVALRRVIRAIDLHSRQLVQSHGLTGPQALILKETVRRPGSTVGQLAKRVSLSQATVTDILNRLEGRRLISRERSRRDRRRVEVRATADAATLLHQAPPLLQERFASRFAGLADWEQSLLLASLERIATMMDAAELDAAPVLSSGSVTASPEAVEQVIDASGHESAAGRAE